MKAENIGHTVRQFIPMGGAGPMLETFMEKVNVQAEGGQLMQAAIYCRQPDLVKALIQRGVDLANPPAKVPPLQAHPDCHSNYRQSPFIIQAACAGDKKTMEILMASGCSLNDVGHIALSKRHKNSLAHNVIGAAAYHGHADVLEFCFRHLNAADVIDVKGQETADRVITKGSPFKPELHDFTPL